LRAASKLVPAAVALLAGACSLDTHAYRECADHADCREAFGFGAVCGRRGLCEAAQPSARCANSYPDDLWTAPERHRGAIVFASLMDHSSEAHVTRENAIRLAIAQANQAGGLREGEPRGFALVMCDIKADAAFDELTRSEAAVRSAQFAARTLGVPALIGPSASSDVEQVFQAVHDTGALLISPAATSPALAGLEGETSEEHPGLLWRVAPTDALQGRVIAEDMRAREVTRVRVIRETGAYGEGLAAIFSARFRELSPAATIELTSISSEAQAKQAAAGLSADDPAEVLFISSQQAWIVTFLTAAGAAPSFAERGLFLTDAAANKSVLTAAASAASLYPRVRGTRPAPGDPNDYVLASFIAEYRASNGGASPMTATFSAHAYDAAWLTVYGAAWSHLQEGRVFGEGIARGLRHVSEGADLPVVQASWASLLAAFRAGRAVNLRGASGDLDFHPSTREVSGRIELWTIGAGATAGEFTMVKLDTRMPQGQ
jgi:ABC-type branched-subunit amino acid transport system substrate-binding protein